MTPRPFNTRTVLIALGLLASACSAQNESSTREAPLAADVDRSVEKAAPAATSPGEEAAPSLLPPPPAPAPVAAAAASAATPSGVKGPTAASVPPGLRRARPVASVDAFAGDSRLGGRRTRGLVGSPSRTFRPDAPGVKAGEWDDNANYQAFTQYLAAQHHAGLQRMDLSHRRFVVVRDEAGKGIPNCTVRVADGQASTSITTTASGRALLFPRAMGMTAGQLTASTSCQGGHSSVTFAAAAADGTVELRLALERRLPQRRTVDVAFILDTTGSMGEEIAAVKATIQKVAAQLDGENTAIRVGLVEYKDRSDDIHTQTYDFTSDLGAFQQRIASVRASGGGDHPEDAIAGLRVGLSDLSWSDTSVARMAFVIGDAPPHLDYAQDSEYLPHLRNASKRGIKLYTVAASGMDGLGQAVWRQMAQFTGGTNMFIKRGGAGPQSAGGGAPKDACGSTHQNFTSGELDKLIVRKGQTRDHVTGTRSDAHRRPRSGRELEALQ